MMFNVSIQNTKREVPELERTKFHLPNINKRKQWTCGLSKVVAMEPFLAEQLEMKKGP